MLTLTAPSAIPLESIVDALVKKKRRGEEQGGSEDDGAIVKDVGE